MRGEEGFRQRTVNSLERTKEDGSQRSRHQDWRDFVFRMVEVTASYKQLGKWAQRGEALLRVGRDEQGEKSSYVWKGWQKTGAQAG